jgi:hypothetical protein
MVQTLKAIYGYGRQLVEKKKSLFTIPMKRDFIRFNVN